MDVCGAELEDGTLCQYSPPPDARPNNLGLHRWSAHGIRADGTVVDRTTTPAPRHARPEEPVEAGSPFAPLPSGETPPARGGADQSADGHARPRRGLLGRFRRDQKPELEAPRKTQEKTPKAAKGKRLSGAETLADAGGLVSSAFMNMGHVPTGRLVAFQAPAAGELVDELVKGTMFDSLVLQRIVRSRGILDTLFALFAPAKFTWEMEKAVAENDTVRFQRAEAGLKWAIKEALPTMIPAMKKVRDREAKQAAALVELLDMADLEMLGIYVDEAGQPRGKETGNIVDIGDIFAAMLFAEWVPPAPPPAPKPEEDPARV